MLLIEIIVLNQLLLGLSNTGAGLFLRNSSGTTIDLIGWGTAIAVNYEGYCRS